MFSEAECTAQLIGLGIGFLLAFLIFILGYFISNKDRPKKRKLQKPTDLERLMWLAEIAYRQDFEGRAQDFHDECGDR